MFELRDISLNTYSMQKHIVILTINNRSGIERRLTHKGYDTRDDSGQGEEIPPSLESDQVGQVEDDQGAEGRQGYEVV